ncbi:hypothetical protein VOLCADRAFT_93012 [Volvox carteri f. nagariensis]|uniref:TLC domain-containing protein n=1 Tax=Volvox carteri f. nagariensis TaxID=3068 RepID=D8U139_VOLCA|nr:uncharacterized protein VOLCADRAFT_93012 [Volvox carteri f. nagariensis]EFJ46565.1 hypothetical protein VOLCADRAFT_93012 [Volvox carteri f. nagariensis]|eukprot:XP_002952422.1 hypothetical protein VOLCADRAFT_93012 [Volvox carteri f. nagariensis]
MLLGDAASSCLIAAVFGACGILGLRYVFYVAVYERVRLYLRRRGPGYEMYTPVVTEELWEGLGSAGIVALGSWALYSGHNAGCTLTDTSGCLRGWPDHSIPWTIDALFLLHIAWYTQCTTKHWFGLGRLQGLDAALHHAFTLCLHAMSYTLKLLRVGLLAHWIFVATNPLLSVSKLLHCLDVRPGKKVFFVFFATCYLATRVLMVPIVLLPCTLIDVWHIPLDHRAASAANGFLLLLYGLSLFWFGRLLGILLTGKLDSTPRMVVAAAEVRRWQKRQAQPAGGSI